MATAFNTGQYQVTSIALGAAMAATGKPATVVTAKPFDPSKPAAPNNGLVMPIGQTGDGTLSIPFEDGKAATFFVVGAVFELTFTKVAEPSS